MEIHAEEEVAKLLLHIEFPVHRLDDHMSGLQRAVNQPEPQLESSFV
jgi:hypothetical protein